MKKILLISALIIVMLLVGAIAMTISNHAPSDRCVAQPGSRLRDQDFKDEQLPWRRKAHTKVTIYFVIQNLTPEYLADMRKAAGVWNKSPCLNVRLVKDCGPNVNCVTVSLKANDGTGDDGNFNAIEKHGYTTGGHIDLYYQRLDRLGPGATLNVVTHEMGHAIGLRHRLTPHVLMNADTYTDVFYPDKTDYDNLLVLYGNQ